MLGYAPTTAGYEQMTLTFVQYVNPRNMQANYMYIPYLSFVQDECMLFGVIYMINDIQYYLTHRSYQMTITSFHLQ